MAQLLMWCTYTVTTTGLNNSRQTSSKKKKVTLTSYWLAIHSLQCTILSTSNFYCILQPVLTQESLQPLTVLVGISNFIIQPSLQSWTCDMDRCQYALTIIFVWTHHSISTRRGTEEISWWNKPVAVSVASIDVSWDKTVSGCSLIWQEVGLCG